MLVCRENRNVVLLLLKLALIITSGQAGSADPAKTGAGLVPVVRDNPRTEGFTRVFFYNAAYSPNPKIYFQSP